MPEAQECFECTFGFAREAMSEGYDHLFSTKEPTEIEDVQAYCARHSLDMKIEICRLEGVHQTYRVFIRPSG